MQRHLPERSPWYPQGQGCVALFLHLPVQLKSLKLKGYVETPKTLGEHVKRRRTILGLTQTEAAKQLKVDAITVLNWEKGKTEPPTYTYPAIIRFLGYDAFPKLQTLPERMLACRRAQGWSLKQAARQFGIDEETWSLWEDGKPITWRRHRKRVEAFLVGAMVSPPSD